MKKRLVALFVAAAFAAMTLAGCGGSASTSAPADGTAAQTEEATEETAEAVSAETTNDAAAAAPGEAAGFEETPIFEGLEIPGLLSCNAVFFQPVPMTGGYDDISDYNMHIEADVSAIENNLGYGVGDWIPYLTVDYKIIASDGSTAAEGTFMPMAASDGPHYGANISLPNADTYKIEFTFHSPSENGYLIHTDEETGPGGVLEDVFADGNITLTYEGWDYTPQEW